MNGEARTSILKVRLAAPSPARSSTLETKSGAVRWALFENTLLIQPERPELLADRAHMEHLIRTVMRRSGLARRYHVFTVAADGIDGPVPPPDR